jgi:spore coat polysaccharide biosynthesis predicted glycosyltransferase SpsG
VSWAGRLRRSRTVLGGYTRFNASNVSKVPVAEVDFGNRRDASLHERLVALVDQMLSLHKSIIAAKSGHEKEAIQRQIDATDPRIDRLVYDLYGLTEEEIKLVEEATATR